MVDATPRAAGLRTVPYRVGGRDSGCAAGPDRARGPEGAPRDWGFVLASRTAPVLSLPGTARAAEHTRLPGLPASTLVHPRYAG